MAGTYASLWFTNKSARRLHAWGKAQNIQGLYEPENFHVTVCYSKKEVPYFAIASFPPMQAAVVGYELFGDNKNVLVAKLKCPFAVNRFDYSQMIGAISDYPEYIPHVTLSDDPGDIDIESLPIIPFKLYLESEKVEEIKEDWKPKADKK